MGRTIFVLCLLMLLNHTDVASQQRITILSDSLSTPVSLKVLPRNFYNQQLSFFCKKEWQLQKLISVPLFIRVGSKNYVDYLENKPNATPYRQ